MSNKRDYYEKITAVDKLLLGNANKRDILRYYDDKKILEYFFRKVDGWEWYIVLKEAGMIEPHSSPGIYKSETDGSYIIPEWIILPFLERLSRQLKKSENEQLEKELLWLIRESTLVRDDNRAYLDNYKTWGYFIRILANISNKHITDEIIDLVPIWLESKFDVTVQGTEIIEKLIPKFLNNQADEDDIRKAEKIFDYITDLKPVLLSKESAEIFGETAEFRFRIDMYWLEKCFSENYERMALLCSLKLIEKIVNKVEPILRCPEAGAYLSFYSEGSVNEPLDMFKQILINLLNRKAQIVPCEVAGKLASLLAKDRFFFQKIAIYILAENEPVFSEQIWENIDRIIGTSYMRLLFVGDELNHLLARLGKLSVKERAILNKAINRGPASEGPEDKGSIRKEKTANWKQKLYGALSADPFFKKRYELIKEKTGEDAQLSAGIVRLETHWGVEKSPLCEEDIINKTNKELADYLVEFKTGNRWEGPSVDGLSNVMKETVEKYHTKFTSDLSPFLRVGYLYVWDILWGLRDAWKGKQEIDWEKVLNFLAAYVEQPGFWLDELKVRGSDWNADHQWVIKQIGDLINEGCKDGWSFNDRYIAQAEAVTIRILDKTEVPKEDLSEAFDPVNHALNSAAGNIITAYFHLLWRKSRIKKRTDTTYKLGWAEEERTVYSSLMSKKIPEAFTILGQYLSAFSDIDSEYVDDKLLELLKAEDHLWRCFWTGYLFNEHIYIDLFIKLHEHYIRALRTEFTNKTAEARLIQHIAAAYLWPKELCEAEEAIKRVISLEKPSHFDALTNYFRGQYFRKRRRPADSAKEVAVNANERAKILKLWEEIYEKDRNLTDRSEEQRHVLSLMLRLIVFLPVLNKEYSRWIDLSFANLTGQFNPHLFISDLLSMSDRINNSVSGTIVIGVLNKIIEIGLPFYLISDIKPLVEGLYEIGEPKIKGAIDDLCNLVAEKGIYDSDGELFLRNIYFKYNPR